MKKKNSKKIRGEMKDRLRNYCVKRIDSRFRRVNAENFEKKKREKKK